MYCPKCGSEYREGFQKCSDCNIKLVDELKNKAEIDKKQKAIFFKTLSSDCNWRALLKISYFLFPVMIIEVICKLCPHFNFGESINDFIYALILGLYLIFGGVISFVLKLPLFVPSSLFFSTEPEDFDIFCIIANLFVIFGSLCLIFIELKKFILGY